MGTAPRKVFSNSKRRWCKRNHLQKKSRPLFCHSLSVSLSDSERLTPTSISYALPPSHRLSRCNQFELAKAHLIQNSGSQSSRLHTLIKFSLGSILSGGYLYLGSIHSSTNIILFGRWATVPVIYPQNK